MSTLLKSLSIHPGENLDTSKIQNQKNSKYILEIWCRLVEFNLTKIHTSCSKFTDSLLLYSIISKEYIVLPLLDLILSSTNPEIKKSVCCYYLQVFFKNLFLLNFFDLHAFLKWRIICTEKWGRGVANKSAIAKSWLIKVENHNKTAYYCS